jgi:hypothetical protein
MESLDRRRSSPPFWSESSSARNGTKTPLGAEGLEDDFRLTPAKDVPEDEPWILDFGWGPPVILRPKTKPSVWLFLVFLLGLPVLFVTLPIVGLYAGLLLAGGHLCWHETIGSLLGFLLANGIAWALFACILRRATEDR